MIRRTGIVVAFAVLGFASLLLGDELRTWMCAYFGGLCNQVAGPCPGIDVCTPGALRTIQITAFFFGPSIAFAVIAYLFSRRPRTGVAWIGLAVGLVAAHLAVLMLVLRSA